MITLGKKRTTTRILALGLLSLGLYSFRRRLIGLWLRLPTAEYDVVVERNLRVPMPDGVCLIADHYYPRSDRSFPTILIRTPYGRRFAHGILGFMHSFIAQRFAERGYHVILQDARGRFDSEGEFEPFVNEAADGRATLEWIAKQKWFNGALAMWGQSYSGYVQWAVAAEAPAYLKALVPAITGSTLNPYWNGAFTLDTILRWTFHLHSLGLRRTALAAELMRFVLSGIYSRKLESAFRHLPLLEADKVALGKPIPYYRHWLVHPNADDEFWKARDHRAQVARVNAPAHFVSGWYDILLPHLMADYTALKSAGHTPYLTIGPWHHGKLACLWESLRQGIAWFDATLKGNRRHLRAKPVRIYVMGANEWREMDTWPPPALETRFYPSAQKQLIERPSTDSLPDRYRYDPADPTPSVGGPLLNPTAGPRDNRALESRADVLTYTTEPLLNDVDVIGPARFELYFRSSLAYTDFFARLCDVYPDGRSINICDGLTRVEPGIGEPQPDGSVRIQVYMSSTAHRFLRGHLIRLQLSSGAHPRLSRNLGSGEPVGTGTKMFSAVQTIYHDHAHPSALVLPVVRKNLT